MGGMVKGSGMIYLNMVIMFGVVMCDVDVMFEVWCNIIFCVGVVFFN